MIESIYHDNPFHSFKHASNVCTNANKMLQSIVDEDIFQRTSDPLTQFAVVFSALIHDVDHLGITNMLLTKEKPNIAALYRSKSVAEQNAVDLAWNLLMDPEYNALQDAIFMGNNEFKRFRHLVVNVVMATDIFDKELNGDRITRWKKVFDQDDARSEGLLGGEEQGSLKATVIVEHVMQIADVMHTMQHFHIYLRWNERLFEEMYAAYESGRSTKDPSADWYEGEIWFFDNCVIPLAQRIKDSGVFGVQGDDCLRNAISNKKEWALRGGGIGLARMTNIQEKKELTAATAEEEEKKKDARKGHKEGETQKEKKKKKDPDRHLIEWNVDLCKRLLRNILAHRMAEGHDTKQGVLNLARTLKEGSTVPDEITRIIHFPLFHKKASQLKVDPETVELSKAIQDQLRDYISFIATMYRDNAFHNFKHASNVAMATNKYLQRINNEILEMQVAHPLTRFAIIFSSLIHDVDHTRVTNAQLVKEGQRTAVVYNNKSVADQNSTDLAWSVLMDSKYKDLQAAIYGSQGELESFRQIVVNSVMATYLFDEELIADRNKRWLETFSEEHRDHSLTEDQALELKATIVVEHVMMAADINHTMQDFHSYKRWNERLFFEMCDAYENGLLDKDPSSNWYEQEMKFFNKVVIPLATRLKDCGVFGIAGDNALACAQANRKKWVVKGAVVVAELKRSYFEQKRGGKI
jgi:hypothetical protein